MVGLASTHENDPVDLKLPNLSEMGNTCCGKQPLAIGIAIA
jgi:hypothetical protein